MIRFSPQYRIDDVSSQIPKLEHMHLPLTGGVVFDELVKELSDLPAV